MTRTSKPLGHKNYGSIPHLPGSRRGPGDHKCHEGQAKIATKKARDKHDTIIVTEKLDGSNVGVALIDDTLIPLGRSGYPALSSPYLQHQFFAQWAFQHEEQFRAVLREGERVVGEWLMQAHGTRYDLDKRPPFAAFDIMTGHKRLLFDEFRQRIGEHLAMVPLLSRGGPRSIDSTMALLGRCGFYGARDPVEGAVWRVERNRSTGKKGERERTVDFLVKYVRPDKQDGFYFPENNPTGEILWNWSFDSGKEH